jgi:hypothetical protein
MWLCSSSTSIIEARDPSAHLDILTIRDLTKVLPRLGRISRRVNWRNPGLDDGRPESDGQRWCDGMVNLKDKDIPEEPAEFPDERSSRVLATIENRHTTIRRAKLASTLAAWDSHPLHRLHDAPDVGSKQPLGACRKEGYEPTNNRGCSVFACSITAIYAQSAQRSTTVPPCGPTATGDFSPAIGVRRTGEKNMETTKRTRGNLSLSPRLIIPRRTTSFGSVKLCPESMSERV